MNRRGSRRRRRQGFTLMEVLLVLVILVILGSLVGVGIRQTRTRAYEDAARAQIKLFGQTLDMYDMDIGSYPTSSQGLEALLAAPAGLANENRYRGPYLKQGITVLPLDPWDNPYQYESNDGTTYTITSGGADGVVGTEDDLTN
jgi:general secretion pathway protein G